MTAMTASDERLTGVLDGLSHMSMEPQKLGRGSFEPPVAFTGIKTHDLNVVHIMKVRRYMRR